MISAAVLWGTTGTALALGPDGADPFAVGSLRLAVGGLALVVLSGVVGDSPFRRDWPIVPTLVAAGAMAAYQPLFFGGVTRTGVAVGTLVAIGSAPILAALGARIVRGEQLERRWVIATTATTAGLVLLVAGGASMGIDVLGLLLALGAGAAYATYAIAAKDLLEGRRPLSAMAWIFGWAGLVSAPALLWADLDWLADPGGLVLVLYLGLVTTALAYALFAIGLSTTKVAMAATLTLAEPATAALLALVVLGETISAGGWTGVGLIGIGIAWLARPAPDHQVENLP